MMKIKNITWISKKAKEAELVVTDDKNQCLAFSQPCNFNIGENLLEPLRALDVEHVMAVYDEEKQEKIQKTGSSYFSHHYIARVIDKKEGLVTVGEIKIDLDKKMPAWAGEGKLIEFDCSRLDVW